MYKMGIVGLEEFSSTLDRLGQNFQTAYQSVKNFEELREDINKWWLQYYSQLETLNQQPTINDIVEIHQKFNSTVNIGAEILNFIKKDLVYYYNEHAKKYQDFLLQNNFEAWDAQLRSLVDNSNNLKKILFNLVEGVNFSE
jgi:hypothetical protein